MSVEEIIASGELSMFRGTPDGQAGGKHVKKLEAAFKRYFGVKYAIALNSATSALHASLIGCGVGQGDEVIVTPFSFSSSASCALLVGAKPVFIDIEEDTCCINPDQIEDALSFRTKAIIPVHLFGGMADMARIKRITKEYADVRLIEDAAQAIGAKKNGHLAGTIGDCGIFSFNQSKHINTGEGGMLITNDKKIARIVRAVRNHAETSDPGLKIVGYNYRLGEIEACLALEQFKKLDKEIARRKELAAYLTHGLKDKARVLPNLSWWAFAFKVEHREEVFKKCKAQGLILNKGYNEPLYHLPIYKQFGYKKGMCAVAERMWSEELLTIPMRGLTQSSCDVIINSI